MYLCSVQPSPHPLQLEDDTATTCTTQRLHRHIHSHQKWVLLPLCVHAKYYPPAIFITQRSEAHPAVCCMLLQCTRSSRRGSRSFSFISYTMILTGFNGLSRAADCTRFVFCAGCGLVVQTLLDEKRKDLRHFLFLFFCGNSFLSISLLSLHSPVAD